MTAKDLLVGFAYAAFGFGLSFAVGDAYLLATGIIVPDGRVPFLISVVAFVIGYVALPSTAISAEGAASRPDQFDKNSFLHPDNHPKGRINAPAGTSD